MNAFLLMIPLFLIRFGLLGRLGKEALRHAKFFAPLERNEKIIFIPYQISNLFLIFYPLALKIQTESPLFIVALLAYAAGVCVLILSTVSFAKPNQSGINTGGIYAVSRNPMYMGYDIYFLGCVLLARSLPMFIAWVIFVVSTHWIIISEERWCVSQFGDEYICYMNNVRRYI